MNSRVFPTVPPDADARVSQAAYLMERFVVRTGLASAAPVASDLWVACWAAENLLDLAWLTRESGFLELAVRWVDTVHHTLGKYRLDDPRGSGWLSGLSADQGAVHPTRGGLRIGNFLPERDPYQPVNGAEKDRDGQYFHYLARWMKVLARMAEQTLTSCYGVWAVELAEVAYKAFAHRRDGRARMYWKLSSDLTRSLVYSMGLHEPLDGLVAYLQLERQFAAPLGLAVEDFLEMLEGQDLSTFEPMALGGLLLAACGLHRFPDYDELRKQVYCGAARGLEQYSRHDGLDLGLDHRQPFRELGLAVGLACARRLPDCPPEVLRHGPLQERLLCAWNAHSARQSLNWVDHRDINEVLLASALLCSNGSPLPLGPRG